MNTNDIELRQRVKLARLGDPVVVRVPPQPESGEYGVRAVNRPVAVTALRGLVELGEG